MTKRKTHEEFIEELKHKNNNDFTVLETYINSLTKIKVLFNDCGHTREMYPTKLLINQGCGDAKCLALRLSEAKLNKRRETITQDLKDKGYKLLSDYNGNRGNIEVLNIACGHEYSANAGNVLTGSGCPICFGMKNTDSFKQEMMDKYSDEYTILGEYVNNKTKIKVKHDTCGHIWKTTPKVLLRDRCCPKCNKSKGEHYVREFLSSERVTFSMEHKFDDCKYINPLPFDFAVVVDGELKLIEFDGSQHFGHSNYWGKDTFEIIKRNDNIKNKYCKKNNIPLLRIPYWWLRNDRIDKELKKFIG